MMKNNVDHPAHYAGSTSIECIEAMKIAFGYQAVYSFCVCNAFKYLWRYKNKNGQEDIEKARWYLEKAALMDTKQPLKINSVDLTPLWDTLEGAMDWLKNHSDKTD